MAVKNRASVRVIAAQLDEAGWWRPVRRSLGITAFGVNAYTADAADKPLIEPHDELGATGL